MAKLIFHQAKSNRNQTIQGPGKEKKKKKKSSNKKVEFMVVVNKMCRRTFANFCFCDSPRTSTFSVLERGTRRNYFLVTIASSFTPLSMPFRSKLYISLLNEFIFEFKKETCVLLNLKLNILFLFSIKFY